MTKEQAINAAKYMLKSRNLKSAYIYRIGREWMYTSEPIEIVQKYYVRRIIEYIDVL